MHFLHLQLRELCTDSCDGSSAREPRKHGRGCSVAGTDISDISVVSFSSLASVVDDASTVIVTMRIQEIAVFCVFAVCTFAAPAPPHVLHEKRGQSKSWTKRNRVYGGVKLPMRIGLTQSNLDRGHDLLMEVSHPGSPSYGKHYTVQEVTELFAPAQDTVDTVRSWLESAGIRSGVFLPVSRRRASASTSTEQKPLR